MTLTKTKLLAVCSGKGGAGKSEVVVSTAIGLTQLGYRVAILDADIDNPNIPEILGCGRPEICIDRERNIMYPVIYENLQVMSVGFSIPAHAPVLWRGKQRMEVVKDLFDLTVWDHPDYLLVDCSAGTGDSLRAVFQQPLIGAIVVTNPHDAAIAGAKRARSMIREYNISYMGLILNMASLVCGQCHAETPLPFEYGDDFSPEEIITRIPFDLQIRQTNRISNPQLLAAKILKVEGRNLYQHYSKKILMQHTLMKKALEKLP